MECYHPNIGYRNYRTGVIQFKKTPETSARQYQVPCGQCIGCRLERSRQWALRCVHEAQMHDENSFVTLTYREENLPEEQSINVRDVQLFIKKLRKKLQPKKIRFFLGGEYREEKTDDETGEIKYGPHYHACIFGHDWPDKELWKEKNGVRIYKSDSLEKLWGHGFVTAGDVTFESAAYIARYICKKITGHKAEAHYQNRKPEFITMSRRPGIASAWLKKYETDVYPADDVVIRGKQMKPPKFYDRIFEATHPEKMEEIKKKREKETVWTKGLGYRDLERTPERLAVKKIVKEAQIKSLKRDMEASQ